MFEVLRNGGRVLGLAAVLTGAVALSSCKEDEKIVEVVKTDTIYKTPDLTVAQMVAGSYFGFGAEAAAGKDTVYTDRVLVRVSPIGADSVSVECAEYDKNIKAKVVANDAEYSIKYVAVGSVDSLVATIKDEKSFSFYFYDSKGNIAVVNGSAPEVTPIQKVAGEYTGYFRNGNDYKNNVTVSVDKKGIVTLGDYTFENVEATEAKGVTTITGSTTFKGVVYDLKATVKNASDFSFAISSAADANIKIAVENGFAPGAYLIQGEYRGVNETSSETEVKITAFDKNTIILNLNDNGEVQCSVEDDGTFFYGLGIWKDSKCAIQGAFIGNVLHIDQYYYDDFDFEFGSAYNKIMYKWEVTKIK